LLLWIWVCESFTNCLALALFCLRTGQEDWFFKARLTTAKWLSSWEMGSKEALISSGSSWLIDSSTSSKWSTSLTWSWISLCNREKIS
jgi:hypothetical protein